MVINCHRYASSGFLAGFSGAKHIAGFKQNPFSFLFNYTAYHRIGDGTHEVERYNQLIEDFSDKNIFKPKLYPSTADYNKIKQYTIGDYVCMAPASVWFTKQLPKEKWVELCNKIDLNISVYLLGAATDKDLCEEIKQRSNHKNITVLCGELNLLQSCALMEKAGMNYVNDSAPLHLASSVNAPVTAFFCSTVPQFGFGPLSDKRTIIQVEGLNCKPCGLHGFKQCPLGHFKCGHLVQL
ncbi:MAG: glycosyltransferase family 9 protein [Bacteroidia bacterium]|nr:glycosyltransferase family 9 protein [Bacteroidia bacterium]